MYSKVIEELVCYQQGHQLQHVSPGVSNFLVFCRACGLLLDLDAAPPKKAKKGK